MARKGSYFFSWRLFNERLQGHSTTYMCSLRSSRICMLIRFLILNTHLRYCLWSWKKEKKTISSIIIIGRTRLYVTNYYIYILFKGSSVSQTELRFPSRSETEGMQNVLRHVVIPETFQSAAGYKQVLTAALTGISHLNNYQLHESTLDG